MILDLCGVMEHFFEGNCFLRIIFGSGYDLGPMWGHGALLRRELCFEDSFWVLNMILDLCGVMEHFFEGNCVFRPSLALILEF